MAGVPLLAACTGRQRHLPAAGAESSGLTFGSGSSDEVPKRPTRRSPTPSPKKTGKRSPPTWCRTTTSRTRSTPTSRASPDDTFTWFAGYRMQYYAGKGLLAPIDDVWEKIGGNYSDALKKASTGADGKMYFDPELQLPLGLLLPEEPLGGEGVRGPDDVRCAEGPRHQDEGRRPRSRSNSRTRTAGPPWARSTT